MASGEESGIFDQVRLTTLRLLSFESRAEGLGLAHEKVLPVAFKFLEGGPHG